MPAKAGLILIFIYKFSEADCLPVLYQVIDKTPGNPSWIPGGFYKYDNEFTLPDLPRGNTASAAHKAQLQQWW